MAAVLLLALLAAPSASLAAAGGTSPPAVPLAGEAEADLSEVGVEARDGLAEGVEHLVVEGDELAANVAVVDPHAPFELRTVVAGGNVGGRAERPSAMCRRVRCVVAVNGDFRLPGTNLPVGGVVRDGLLLRSPSPTHHQLLIADDGSPAAGPVRMRGRLVASDLSEITIDSVNAERQRDRVVLYTEAFGSDTGTNRFGVEVPLRVIRPASGLRLGATLLVELGAPVEGEGSMAVPEEGAVLSAHGEGARELLDLWDRIEGGESGRRALLRVEAEPPAEESLGGTPILLRDGQRWVSSDGSSFIDGRHPRTVVGWNDEGRVWIVTIDGRQPGHSGGATLHEATDLLVALGATDALNLDGGGSTVFSVGGEVVNRPSDRLVVRDGRQQIVHAPVDGDRVLGNVERPSLSALALVPEAGESPPPDPLEGEHLDLPEVDAPQPTTPDPASVPGADLPALVATSSPTTRLDPWPVMLAALALGTVTSALVSVSGRRGVGRAG